MKRIVNLLLLLVVCVLASQPVFAQKVTVSPTPQNVSWGDAVAFTNDVAYTLVGEADADAVALFKKNFATDGALQVVMGERGDAAVADYEALIPQKAEGYYLSVTADKVVINRTVALKDSFKK